jgi:hypothetical protein
VRAQQHRKNTHITSTTGKTESPGFRVVDVSYYLIQKNAARPYPSHSIQIHVVTIHTSIAAATNPCACRPTLVTRPPHQDSDTPASAHAYRLPDRRIPASACPPAAPRPPPWLLHPGLRHSGRCQSSGLRFGHLSRVLWHPRHQAHPDSDASGSDPPPPRRDSDARSPPRPDAISRLSSAPRHRPAGELYFSLLIATCLL